jgi:anthraniloyl-CoA monooxygenase
VHVVCIGGGPAGLYLGILLKLRDPRHHVAIYERNRPADTFGFGVVFSVATLGHLEAADPVSYAELSRHFARWDDIEIHVGGQVLRSTGHGFCGLERKQLLNILQARAVELGVELHFEREVASLDDAALADADVIVAADGVGSGVREVMAAALGPHVDVRPNKFVWLGTTVPYRAFTFLFKETRYGLFRVHAYPFSEGKSTFIAECRPDTWEKAGFDRGDEAHTVAVLEELFAEELAGHRLIRNRSIWRNFPTVRCQAWHAGRLVIMGDAAHTAHFSIGSGTKLAMEDSIELAAALADVEGAATSGGQLDEALIAAALARYEGKRKPEVEALQAAAEASLDWFEGTERVMAMAPAQFAYHLMTRSLRVSHKSMRKRDPELAAQVEALLGGERKPAAVTEIVPRKTATTLGGHKLWRREVIEVEREGGTVLVMPVDGSGSGSVIGVVAREVSALRALRASVDEVLAVGLAVRDEAGRRAAIVAELAAARAAGLPLDFALVRPAAELAGERLAAVPLADRIRNELGLAVVVELEGTARGEDVDAVIAAGRADLVLLPAASPLFGD